jgi:chorismate dehydratase
MGEEKLRLGKVSYKNTLPLFYGWKLPFVEIVEGTPSELANGISVGMLDGGILSSLYYIQSGARFSLLPDISISSFGKVRSVLILSEKPLEEIRTLKISPESLSSNFITYAVLKKYLKIPVRFVKGGKTDAELVIGDRALERLKVNPTPFVYDVGELWFKNTGLPAVFAVFIVPTRWLVRYPEKASELALTLINSKERFFKDLPDLNLDGETKDYLLNLNYDFREPHLESLKLLEQLYRDYTLGKL